MKKPSMFGNVFRKLFRSGGPNQQRESGSQSLLLEQLEPRILYSAAPVSEAPPPEGEDAATEDIAAAVSEDEAAPTAADPGSLGNALQAPELNVESLESLVLAATQRWQEAGLSGEQLEALYGAEYAVKDLGGKLLGTAEGSRILIDDDAAGLGWFIDATPDQDEEYGARSGTRLEAGADSVADGRYDLLTTLMHEQGHLLGLPDVADDLNDLLYGELEEGERRLPAAGQAEGAQPGSLEGTRYLQAADSFRGDFSVYTGGGGETITTSEFFHTFSNTVRETNTSHELNGSQIALSQGHHLVLYNSRFDDTTGSERSEVQTNLSLNGNDLAAGWSQGYIRRASGDDEAITSGGAIIEAGAAGDVLTLESFRTDSNPGAGMQREPNATGLQLLKLNDNWNYARLSLGSDASVANSAAFNNVVYDSIDELDSAGFSYNSTTGDINLTEGGNYLVLANSQISTGTTGGRAAFLHRLALNGTGVDGTQTSVYLRGADGTNDGAATIGTVINASAGQNLSVQVAEEFNSPNGTLTGGRTAVTIVRLPDTGQYLRTNEITADNSGQNLNPGGGNAGPNTAVSYDTVDEIDAAAFSRPDDSTVQVQQTGSYLFLNQWFDAADSDTTARKNVNQGYQVNGGGVLDYGQSARYNREGNPNESAGNWGGALLDLNAGDEVQVLTGRLGAGGVATANEVALQGILLESIFNTAPVVNGVVDFTPITEDDTANNGDAVGDLTAPDTDADGDPIGIVVTGSTVSAGEGKWQFSQDDGASWTDLGNVSDAAALLLVPSDRVRFVPDGIEGGTADLSYRLWDGSDRRNSGDVIDASFANLPGGGFSAYSTASVTSNLTVTGVDDPPVARDDSFVANTSVAFEGNLFFDNGNGIDENADRATYSVNSSTSFTTGQGATVNINASTGEFTYDATGGGVPAGDFTDSFTYTIEDAVDGSTATATVNLSVIDAAPPAAADDGPFALDLGTAPSLTVNSGSGGLLDNDGAGVALVAGGVSDETSAAGATISYLGTDGSFTYDASNAALLKALAEDETFTDSFDYVIEDTGTGARATAEATVTVTGEGAIEIDLTGDFPPITPPAFQTPQGTGTDDDVQVTLDGGEIRVEVNGVVLRDPGAIVNLAGTPDLSFAGTEADTESVTLDNLAAKSLGTVTVDATIDNFTVVGGLDADSVDTAQGTAQTLEGTFTTSGDQVYSEPVVLTGDAEFVSTGGDITFQSTIDSAPGQNFALTVTAAGEATFNGDIGQGSALTSLDASGSAQVNLVNSEDFGELFEGQATVDFDFSRDGDLTDNLVIDPITSGDAFLIAEGEDAPYFVEAAVDGTLPAGITRAVNFIGGRTEVNGAGGLNLQLNSGGDSPQDITPAPDGDDASFEYWVRPDVVGSEQFAYPAQSIWETGGGTGIGFAIAKNGELVYRIASGSNVGIRYDLNADPEGVLDNTTPGSFRVGQWMHILGTLDFTNNEMVLYLNGTEVGRIGGVGATDWDGGDASALGATGGNNFGGQGGGNINFASLDLNGDEPIESFNGQMGLFRIYREVLDDTQVSNNFTQVNVDPPVVPPPASSSVSTTGDQLYSTAAGSTVIGANTELNAGGAVSFNGTVDDDGEPNTNSNVAIGAGGAVTFSDTVGNTSVLRSLDVDSGGTITINGGDAGGTLTSVGTEFDQSFSGPLVTADGIESIFESANGNLTIGGSLTSGAGSSVTMSANNVTVSGASDFDADLAVTVGNNVTLNGVVDLAGDATVTAGTNAVFGGAFNGATTSEITIAANNLTQFGGTVTAASLNDGAGNRTDLAGDLTLSGPGDSSFGKTLRLTTGTVTIDTSASDAALSFEDIESDGSLGNLILETGTGANASEVTFNGVIGAIPLDDLTLNGEGQLTFENGLVNTVGTLSIADSLPDFILNATLELNVGTLDIPDGTFQVVDNQDVVFSGTPTLAGNLTLTHTGAGDVFIDGVFDGGTNDLTIDTSAGQQTVIRNAVENVGTLTLDDVLFELENTGALPAATLDYTASDDGTPDVWEGNTDPDDDFSFGGDVTLEELVQGTDTDYVGLTHAYRFTGGTGSSNRGLNDLAGDPSNNAATWEFWFKPDAAGTGIDRIYETGGGGDGMAIVYDHGSGEVIFTVDDGGTQRQVSGGSLTTGEFNQIVAVYAQNDVGVVDRLEIFIDGVSVGAVADTTALNDFDGGDTATLGGSGTGLAQTSPSDEPLEGDIAIFRFYETALTRSHAVENFATVTGAAPAIATVSSSGDQVYNGTVTVNDTLGIDGGVQVGLLSSGGDVDFTGNLDLGIHNLSADVSGGPGTVTLADGLQVIIDDSDPLNFEAGQLAVLGGVSITGGDLTATGSSLGDANNADGLIVVDNDGTGDAIGGNGGFDNATVDVDGTTFDLAAGDGNDVSLTNPTPAPLTADGGDSGADGSTASTTLTLDTVQTLAEAAEARWEASGLSQEQLDALAAIEYQVADLTFNMLGAAQGSLITIDIDGAGREWFVDETPLLDEEFGAVVSPTRRLSTEQEVTERMDLLTTLIHEQGHVLGLEDIQGIDRNDVMYAYLAEGERRLPADGQALGAEPGSVEGDTPAYLAGGESTNQSPTFELSQETIRVSEDSGTVTLSGFLHSLSPGPAGEEAQTASLEMDTILVSNPDLFASGPMFTANGDGYDLTFTPASNATGESSIVVEVSDNGPDLGEPASENATRIFSIVVEEDHADAPSFQNLGNDGASPTDPATAPRALTSFGSLLASINEYLLNDGDPSTQAISGVVLRSLPNADSLGGSLSLNQAAAFVDQYIPLSEAGHLIYDPDPDGDGKSRNSVSFSYQFRYQDGTLSDTVYYGQRFNKEAPLRGNASVSVPQGAGEVVRPGFASGIDIGDASPASLRFEMVDNTRPDLFGEAPSLGLDGTLRFSTAPGASGSSLLTVRLTDGGALRSASQSFFIHVQPGSSGSSADPPPAPLTAPDSDGAEQSTLPSLLLGYRSAGVSGLSLSGSSFGVGSFSPSTDLTGSSLLLFEDPREFERTLANLVSQGGYSGIQVFDFDRLSRAEQVLLFGDSNRVPQNSQSGSR